jgi:cytochrome c peroxidase
MRSTLEERRVRRARRGTAAALCVALVLAAAGGVRARRARAEALAPSDTLPLGLDWEPATYVHRGDVRADVIELGRELFFDGRLSRSGDTSCATCHDPARAFTDGRTLALGDAGTEVARNAPAVFNRAMGRAQFWDGRAETLAEQALGPLLAPDEMGMTRELFRERFGDDPRFRRVFGSAPSLELAATAIAAFEATLVSGDSAFDRYEWRGDAHALGEPARRGLTLFRGKAGCSTCHVGTNFSDEALHDIGIGKNGVFGRFKTPTLRNVTRTAPYMHDGSLATLADVVRYYADGGTPHPGLDPEIRPRDLSEEERADLVAFLEALDGPIVALSPRLFAEGPR